MFLKRLCPATFAGVMMFVSTTSGAASDENVQAAADRIDKHISAKWSAERVQPAPRADDAEFLRRVYLDLAGRIPSVEESRTFQDDAAPDKRRLMVDRLLAGPRYVTHFTNVWSSLLMPEAGTNLQARFLAPGFRIWVREQLAKNAGYDKLIRELMTTPIDRGNLERIYERRNRANPLAYFLAKEAAPENLAAATARVFLGIRIECAQCHNHPFASWKREQFWGYAAFFAGIKRQNNGEFVIPINDALDNREITIPGLDRVVQASFPDGSEPAWKFKVSARITLVDWMTAPDNPYFARAAVNRMWFYFFGRGLIDPVDDMVGGDSTASHPELLDELAKDFAANRFDLKFLIRAITASEAYQLSSARTHASQDQPHLFARAASRGLSPEQLFDSVAQATGFREPIDRDQGFDESPSSEREEFLSKFANQSDRPTDHTTSILQALTLMNGRLVSEQTGFERSRTLNAVIDASFMSTPQRVETLFLATLSRKPKPKEMERALKLIEAGAAHDKVNGEKEALSDVFWALLNLGEFYLNH